MADIFTRIHPDDITGRPLNTDDSGLIICDIVIKLIGWAHCTGSVNYNCKMLISGKSLHVKSIFQPSF